MKKLFYCILGIILGAIFCLLNSKTDMLFVILFIVIGVLSLAINYRTALSFVISSSIVVIYFDHGNFWIVLLLSLLTLGVACNALKPKEVAKR